MSKVAIVHTNLSLIEPLGALAQRILPGVEVDHIVDDGLLRYARKRGVDEKLTQRMCAYFRLADEGGAEIILSACSSVGATVDVARKMLDTPILKIDEPMVEEAVERGGTIAVLATVSSTLHPTCQLIERVAKERRKEVTVKPYLHDGALDMLLRGDAEAHDTVVMKAAHEAAKDADVVLFAQGSMARLASRLKGGLAKPLLTSPESAMHRMAAMLRTRTAPDDLSRVSS